MSFLIDTKIVSELGRDVRANAGVRRWFEGAAPHELFLSVVTIGEIRRGVVLLQRRDAVGAAHVNRRMRTLLTAFADRILPVDRAVAEEWGALTAAGTVPQIDALLAATARVHSLTLVTRNVKDVASTGVHCLDPFVEK